MNIGVVGNGFVGEAIRENLKSEYNIIAFDINPEKSDCQSVAELTESVNLFLCLFLRLCF